MDDPFSATYREARIKFIEAALSADAVLESHRHPSHKGPDGEELAVDVASFGSSSCKRLLMVVSGTHGVEGHAGSACQVALLKSDLLGKLAASCRVILVHAVNPYGFAHTRRTNEDNIDLNRNFVDFSQPLPQNPSYVEHARAFLPMDGSLEQYIAARDRLEREAAARGGYQFLKRALQPGQYEFPQDLYYGGSAPCWSNVTFLGICRQVFAGCESAAVLDLHTGLGDSGVGELIFMTRELFERCAQDLPGPVSCAGVQASVTASVQGPLVSAAYELLPARKAICCALEFGTVSLKENVQAKICENWAHHYLPATHPLRKQSQQRFKDAYFCDNPGWKKNVIQRSNEVVESLHRSVTTI